LANYFPGLKAAKLSILILSITIKKDNAMEMKNPVHPGLLVKDCLDDLGLTVAEVAAALHITRQQLHNIVAGRSSITPEMAIRFEKAFGSTADTWLRMQMNYDLAQVRQRAAEIVVERLTPKVA
jgi:addiction module HigA family antidote